MSRATFHRNILSYNKFMYITYTVTGKINVEFTVEYSDNMFAISHESAAAETPDFSSYCFQRLKS